MMRISSVSIVICLFCCSPIFADEVGIDIFGLSYHPDRRDSSGKRLNELNPGVGLNYIVRETKQSIIAFDAGFYKDSGSNLSKFVAAGYRFKIQRMSFGGMFVMLQSKTFNSGKLVFAPLPMVSYRMGPVSFHLLYLPQYKDVNRNSAFGFFSTFHLK